VTTGELFEFIVPPEADILTRMNGNGNSRSSAIHTLKLEYISAYNDLQTMASDAHGSISDSLTNATLAIRSAMGVLISENTRLGNLRGLLIRRAHVRRDLAIQQARLATVEAILNDPNSLERQACDLFKLGLEQQHLPAIISGLEAQLVDLDAATLDASTGFDVEAVVSKMLADAQVPLGSGFSDPVIRSLILDGYLSA
jgi:hypothetical protein